MSPERDLDAWLFDDAAGVDVGRGYTLTWTVGPDGSRWPIIVDERQVDEQLVATRPEHFASAAPHELTGKMPDEFQQFRCGQRTNSGRPCKIAVSSPGDRCVHHPVTESEAQVGQVSTVTAAPESRRGDGPRSRPRRGRHSRTAVDEHQATLFGVDEFEEPR